MNVPPIRPSTSFALVPETSLAWYFVIGNWPNSATHPIIEIDCQPMRVRLPDSPQASHDLRATVLRAYPLGEAERLSAKALLAEIDGRAMVRRDSDGSLGGPHPNAG
jgi:hypothetical protein